MDYTPFATCTRCGQMKVQTEGGAAQCLSCSPNIDNPSMVVTIEDPGDDEINKVLEKAGVRHLAGSKPPTPIKPEAIRPSIAPKVETQKAYVPQVIHGSTVESALNILRGLPMPKDLKQFKQINKAIKILESLGA